MEDVDSETDEDTPEEVEHPVMTAIFAPPGAVAPVSNNPFAAFLPPVAVQPQELQQQHQNAPIPFNLHSPISIHHIDQQLQPPVFPIKRVQSSDLLRASMNKVFA